MEIKELVHAPKEVCYIETITNKFKGVVIVSKGSKPFGYISEYDAQWSLHGTIDETDNIMYADTFEDLILKIENAYKQKPITYSVIKFT